MVPLSDFVGNQLNQNGRKSLLPSTLSVSDHKRWDWEQRYNSRNREGDGKKVSILYVLTDSTLLNSIIRDVYVIRDVYI